MPPNKKKQPTTQSGPSGVQHGPPPAKNHVKRLVRNPQPSVSTAPPSRAALLPHVPSHDEKDGWKQRREMRKVNRKVAVMSSRYIQLKKLEGGTPLSQLIQPNKFNSYEELKVIYGWLLNEPRLLQAAQADGLLALEWTMRERDSDTHMWLRRILKWKHEYLTAAYILAGPAMLNDPETAKLAKKTLNDIGLTPLSQLPPA